MKLTNARVKMFKSIEDSGDVPMEAGSTVFVGQNEAGKTAFLQALHKARPFEKGIAFDVTNDYPRRLLNEYLRRHEKNPDEVVILTYQLETEEIAKINEDLGFEALSELRFSVHHKYDGGSVITLSVQETAYVQHRVKTASLSGDVATEVQSINTLRLLISKLDSLEASRTTQDTQFLEQLKSQFNVSGTEWASLLALHIWTHYLDARRPKFVYFDDYSLLKGKINLPQLQTRIRAGTDGTKPLANDDKTVLGLMRVANVEVDELISPTGYEQGRAKLEGISISITDKVFEYWRQNRELDVEFDVRADPKDETPFDSGNNLYIRIRNRRHRVTVPFSQRSKGFIWFFSFIAWFDSVQEQLNTEDELILLLDEPGLSLHALAQADFLRYIDHLAKDYQLIYTTHSPFMVHSDRLNEARAVEDREREGTKVSANISGSDPNTLFPLQAALGYTIAQNLFISKRNLLVEGPADLVYLNFFLSLLDGAGRTRLREDAIIVPAGGLDKIATFVALVGANDLEIVVLHDYDGSVDERLASLVQQKIIRERQVLNYAMFREDGSTKASGKGAAKPSGDKSPTMPKTSSTDVEDLFAPSLYLRLFNATYAKELAGVEVREGDLPIGDRIVDRINRYLKANSIVLRQSGGFNHYLIANHLASHPLGVNDIDSKTLDRFEKLFVAVNRLFLR